MPSGELWNAQWEAAVEVTPGTPVASTRQMYFDETSKLVRVRTPRPHKYATGSRDNLRAFSLGPQMVSGQVALPLSADELVELLLIGVKGAVTPTAQNAAWLWTFTPGTALGAATMRWHDGARPWMASGVRLNKLKIAGGVAKENLITADLFAQSMIQQALTGSLTARVPSLIEGWETKLAIDNFGATPGTTTVAGTLINWDVELDNALQYKFTGDNVNSAGAVIAGEIAIKCKLTFEAFPAAALTEFNNWDGVTKRLVRLTFGNNIVISGTDKLTVTVDLPGAWDAFDLGVTDAGTRVYDLGLQYVYDPTNTFGLQIRCVNGRAAAW